MNRDCNTCKHHDLGSKDEPCRTCTETVKNCYKAQCPDCAKKDAEIAELKAKFDAADTMNHELHKVNTELQDKLSYLGEDYEMLAALKDLTEKLTAETKRADVAERILNNLTTYRDGTRINGICLCCSYELNPDCAPTCLEGYREYAEQQLKEAANGKTK